MSQERHQTYHLQFYMKGISEPQRFRVKKSTYDRLREMLSNIDEYKPAPVPYFVFYGKDGYLVVVSLADIQAVNFLWDNHQASSLLVLPKLENIDDPDELEDGMTLKIYLKGRPNPFTSSSCDPGLLKWCMEQFEYLVDSEENPFAHFADEDDEEVFFCLRQVVLMSVPHLLLPEDDWQHFYEPETIENKKPNGSAPKGEI